MTQSNRLFRLVGKCATVAVLVLLPTLFVLAQSHPSTHGARQKAAAPAPKRPLQKGPTDAVMSELKQRYDVLRAATQAGDSARVAEASKLVVALALKQLGNVQMLVGAAAQSEELYRRSLDFEQTPETRLNLAIAALRAKDAEEAIAQSAIVTGTNPANARAWFVHGKALMAKDDNRAAVESLTRSLALADDVNAQYSLIYALLQIGEKQKAEAAFQQMIATYGDRAIWHVVLAGAYRESKNPTDAIREFRRAIEMDSTVGHAHFFLGLTLLEENHWAQTDQSMAEFREALRQEPNDFFPNFYLGAGESTLKMFDESNRHLKVASDLRPQAPEVWLFLGLNAFQQRTYEPAKEYLLKAIALTTDDSQNAYQIRRAYIALGRIYFIEGRREEAEKYVQRAKEMQAKSLAASSEAIAETMMEGGMGQAAAVLPTVKMSEESDFTPQSPVDMSASIEPSILARAPLAPDEKEEIKLLDKQLRQLLSTTFNDWGTSEARQGMYNMALDHFHEAEKWDNSTPGLMRNIGLASLKLGNNEEAIRALKSAVELQPQDQATRARLAMTLFGENQYAEAAKQFDSLGDLAFKEPGLAYAWGYSLVQANQQKKASEVLNRLSTLSIPAELLVSVGDLSSVLEDYEHAVLDYKKAIQLSPGIPRARYKMGAALLHLNRPAEAIPELESELQLSPSDPEVQYNLAYALLETSQTDRALKMLRGLLQSHPEHSQAHYQLGKSLLEAGQLDEAIQHLEAAAKLDPNSAYVRYQLQTAYRRAGRKDDADREASVYRELKKRKRDSVVIPQAVQNK